MVSYGWSWWWRSFHKDDGSWLILAFSIAPAVLSWYTWVVFKSSRRETAPPLPPGPRGLPVVGNLLFLEPDLHRYFAELAQTYGPIVKLRLGRKLCIVVSSPSLAKEVMKDHDTIFANHDVPVVGFIASYEGMDLFWAPYGEHWRMLRKICVTDMLNNKELDAMSDLRQKEVGQMINQVCPKIGTPVDIGEVVLLTMFNVITSMLWGDGTLKAEEKSRIRADLRQLMEQFRGLFMEINISDLFPAIAWFDIQGVGRRMKKAVLWFDRIFDSVMDQLQMESLEGEKRQEKGKDLLQVLLQLKEKGDPKTPITMTHIKGLFLDMMLAGTDTTSMAVEWALAELLTQPQIMKKAQEELEEVVGLNNVVEESHLPKLHYIHAVVKEVLRLHPFPPFLIPRSPSKSCTVGGFMIPKGTQVAVNAWAIHRDPMYWDNPLEFQPERFLRANSEFDYGGKDFCYIPFGSGRRICAGLPVATRMTPFLLASLLHSFQWQLPDGMKIGKSEKFGFELNKPARLVAIPKRRLSDQTVCT